MNVYQIRDLEKAQKRLCGDWVHILSGILAEGPKRLDEIVEECRIYWTEREGETEASRRMLGAALQTIGAFCDTDRARRAFQTTMERLGIPFIRPTNDERRYRACPIWKLETKMLADALREAGISSRWNDPALRAISLANLVERTSLAIPNIVQGLEREAVQHLGELIVSDPWEERWWYDEAAKRFVGLVTLRTWQGAYGDESGAVAAVNGAITALLPYLEEAVEYLLESSVE